MPKPHTLALLVAALLTPSLASATETATYTYDARGRLVQVTRAVNSGTPVQTTYAYDQADNRTQTATTGAP
jgi:YD repeat-containing protein